MTCSTCGKENESSAKFCGICGTKLVQETTATFENSSSQAPMVGIVESISLGFKNYVKFNGRSTRAEYWWFVLFLFIGEVVLGTIDIFLGTGALQTLFNLVTLIPGLALDARRLHDIGRSGWWQLLQLPTLYIFLQPGISNLAAFAIILPVIPLIIWWIQKGTITENKYGNPTNYVSTKII